MNAKVMLLQKLKNWFDYWDCWTLFATIESFALSYLWTLIHQKMFFWKNINERSCLHMNSIISKIRRWRIELCADVCDDVFECECDEDEKHHISLNLMYEKLQRTIIFATVSRLSRILQRWKALAEFYNFDYFNMYHMLRCNENLIAIVVQFDVILIAVVTFLFENSNLWLIEDLIKQRKTLRELC